MLVSATLRTEKDVTTVTFKAGGERPSASEKVRERHARSVACVNQAGHPISAVGTLRVNQPAPEVIVKFPSVTNPVVLRLLDAGQIHEAHDIQAIVVVECARQLIRVERGGFAGGVARERLTTALDGFETIKGMVDAGLGARIRDKETAAQKSEVRTGDPFEEARGGQGVSL